VIKSTRVVKTVFAVGMLFAGLSASANMAEHASRSHTAGIDLITYQTDVKDVVEIVGYLPAGDSLSGAGNAAVPTLTGMMLDRGTRSQDKFAIARQLEGVGAEISFNVGAQTMQFAAKCLKKDLPLVVGLIASELRTPAFSPQEFAKAKQQLIGMLQNSLHNTDARAHQTFAREVYPAGHPNHPHSADEVLAATKIAKLGDLKAFHAKYYGPEHLTMILVGDVSMPVAQAEVGKAFAGWSGGQDFLRPAGAAVAAAKPDIVVTLADKPSVSVLLGQPTGLRYRDPDALALRVGTAVLGHGFTGRLMSTVRDKQGLTYGIGAGMSDDNITDGMWLLSASFAPALLGKGIASSRAVLETWWKDGITDQELDDRKQGLIGGYLVGLSTTGGLAGAIQNIVQRGYDLAWLDDYPQALQALTLAQVNAAIKAHLNPAEMVLVEAGSVPVH
jgi:zinc protease